MPHEKIPKAGIILPDSVKNAETNPEHFPTREGVLAVLTNSLERVPLRVHRDIRDEGGGLMLLEVRQEDAPSGESIEYTYICKGSHVIQSEGREKRIGSTTNNIDVVFYKEGVPIHATTYAAYDEQARTWKVLP